MPECNKAVCLLADSRRHVMIHASDPRLLNYTASHDAASVICVVLYLGDVHSFGEMICSTGWDRDGEYIATAGISKRLRVFEAGAYTHPLFSSTSAVLVTPPRVPLSNRLGETQAPNISHKMNLRRAEKWTSVGPWFEVAAVTGLGAAVHCPVAEMKTNSKLSSLVWNPYLKHTIASADYEAGFKLVHFSAQLERFLWDRGCA